MKLHGKPGRLQRTKSAETTPGSDGVSQPVRPRPACQFKRPSEAERHLWKVSGRIFNLGRPGLMAGSRRGAGVAQVCNLLYRRFAIGNAGNAPRRPGNPVAGAGCKPAIQQIENLRYLQRPVRDGLPTRRFGTPQVGPSESSTGSRRCHYPLLPFPPCPAPPPVSGLLPQAASRKPQAASVRRQAAFVTPAKAPCAAAHHHGPACPRRAGRSRAPTPRRRCRASSGGGRTSNPQRADR